jgi:hypothetical protein
VTVSCDSLVGNWDEPETPFAWDSSIVRAHLHLFDHAWPGKLTCLFEDGGRRFSASVSVVASSSARQQAI